GRNQDHKDHGTKALGVVVAVDNQLGIVGIATKAVAGVVSEYRPNTPATSAPNPADAIKSAVEVLNPGDVLLLEAQYVRRDGTKWPIEADFAVFSEIEEAWAKGIVVIEPVGNGGSGDEIGADLATFTDDQGKHVLDPTSADFRESGAIMVAAAASSDDHT